MATHNKIPYAKQALSFADQLALLERRGLKVADRPAALDVLARVSYYRLSAYWYPFRQSAPQGGKSSDLQPGTSLEAIQSLYEFDRQLRLLVLDALERIEVALRTAVTYHLGMRYGAFGHEDPQHFHLQFDHTGWVDRLQTTQLPSFVAHYQENYQGFPSMPVWMMSELISLGSLSRLFKGMQNPDKKAIADPLSLHPKRLQDWLHVLTYVRNVCAHHSRLWNRDLSIKPMTMNEPEWSAPLLPRRDKLFCILLMLRYLLRQQSGNGVAWRDACNALLVPIATPQTLWVWGQIGRHTRIGRSQTRPHAKAAQPGSGGCGCKK
ncbi:MAG: Abi family protein [Burkholderiales bacterium]|nr:Abi family protein [Burkholderiales bacterium]